MGDFLGEKAYMLSKQNSSQLNDITQSISANATTKMKGANHYFKNDTGINNLTDGMLNQLKNDGFTHIVLCPILENDDAIDTDNISMQYTANALTAMINKIIALGLKCVVKFHLNRKSDSHSTYGSISPSNATTFFISYQSIVLATLASSQNIELVCLANESSGLCQYFRTNWQTVITAIRTQNPTIKITNSPTFYEIEKDSCVFWDLCDFIGTNIYPCVSILPIPTVQEAIKSVYCELGGNNYRIMEKIYHLCQKYNKNFIITEFGVLPYEYQTMGTGSWIPKGAYNEQVQANYYQGVLDVFLYSEHCYGVFVWGVTDGFTFLGKLAEQVIINSFMEVE